MTVATLNRAEEIAETFALIKQVHPSKLALPAIRYPGFKLIRYPMEEVIFDSFGASKINAALLDAMHFSNCPYVAALIQAINDEYTNKNADQLGQYDEERGNVQD